MCVYIYICVCVCVCVCTGTGYILSYYCRKFRGKSFNLVDEICSQFILGIFLLTPFRLVGRY